MTTRLLQPAERGAPGAPPEVVHFIPVQLDSYRYGHATRRDVQAFVPRGVASLLDVGCGRGLFGAELRSNRPGLVVWGIDPAAESAQDARNNLDRFIEGRYPEDMPARLFDCITFNDSLEHFEDPWGILRVTSSLLAPNGCIIVSLPNVRNYAVIKHLLLCGEWEYRDTGILDRTHLRFFTRRSALRFFAECGYKVEVVQALNIARRGPASWALRLLGPLGKEFRARQFLYVARPG